MLICRQCLHWIGANCSLKKKDGHGLVPNQAACPSFVHRVTSVAVSRGMEPLAHVVQIQSSILANGAGYLDAELLTLLYSDGMVVQGRRSRSASNHTWTKIIPPNPNELEE